VSAKSATSWRVIAKPEILSLFPRRLGGLFLTTNAGVIPS
jgi:hypothetical protein